MVHHSISERGVCGFFSIYADLHYLHLLVWGLEQSGHCNNNAVMVCFVSQSLTNTTGSVLMSLLSTCPTSHTGSEKTHGSRERPTADM